MVLGGGGAVGLLTFVYCYRSSGSVNSGARNLPYISPTKGWVVVLSLSSVSGGVAPAFLFLLRACALLSLCSVLLAGSVGVLTHWPCTVATRMCVCCKYVCMCMCACVLCVSACMYGVCVYVWRMCVMCVRVCVYGVCL